MMPPANQANACNIPTMAYRAGGCRLRCMAVLSHAPASVCAAPHSTQLAPPSAGFHEPTPLRFCPTGPHGGKPQTLHSSVHHQSGRSLACVVDSRELSSAHWHASHHGYDPGAHVCAEPLQGLGAYHCRLLAYHSPPRQKLKLANSTSNT